MIWGSIIDGTTFHNKDELQDYIFDKVGIAYIEIAMQKFSFLELYNNLNEEKRMEIFSKAAQIFQNWNIVELNEDEK